MSRILAVDPGDQRIGLATCDPLGVIARPLEVLQHKSRHADAKAIAEIARVNQADMILVGLPLDDHGEVGPQARKSLRLVEALREVTDLAVETWDESGTTTRALEIAGENDFLDARAAAVLLQDYLDVQASR